MNEVEHFFDIEIEHAEERIENEDTMFFNGVEVGKKIGKQLNEKHISFCKSARRILKKAFNDHDCQIEEMQHHIDCLKAYLKEGTCNKIVLPAKPIEAAEMLIYANYSYKSKVDGILHRGRSYSNSDLRQIAEHLLAYCNNSQDREGYG